ncbi:MAG: histidine kinase N-terminal 7TM domain-containing protein [Alkalispirochaeta sp.]
MGGTDYRIYVYAAPIALTVLLIAMGTVWRYRRRPIAVTLVWYLAMVGMYLIANLLELLAPSPEGTVFWARISLHFFLGSGLAWLALALSYAGFESLSRWSAFRWPTLPALGISVFIWTNPERAFFWTDLGITRVAGFTTMQPEYGPVFWIYGVFLYVLLSVGVVLFLSTGARGRRVIRQQSSLISLAALIPIVVNLLYVFRVIPAVQKDYTPVAFALSGMFFYYAVHRFRLLRVGPIHHHLVLEDVPSAVITVDSEGSILDFNGRAQDLLHVDDGAVGSTIAEAPLLSALVQGVSIDLRNNFEASWPRPDGTEGHFDVWIKPIHHLSGRPAGAVITISDVSDWVNLLEDRNRAYRELEEKRNRLVQLQTQLRRQERLATIGQISAGLAHEISNPLTYIRSGFREVMRAVEILQVSRSADRTDDGDVQVSLASVENLQEVGADVQKGLERIESVVRSLLDFSRGVAHKRERTKVDFARIVENSIALVRPGVSGIELRAQGQDPLFLVCSGDEISQVLLNLLLNAVQAVESVPDTANSERRVTITYKIRAGVLVCAVTDTGPGVPPEIRDQIFDPFLTSRADSSGTGLGLSISSDIVRNGHGGRLYLADGLPTTFVIELPLGADPG